MHLYFSGIGGTGIGPLALIARQAGHQVSGSDMQQSSYIAYLKSQGVDDIAIGQSAGAIETLHKDRPIDWFIYSSALPADNPEMVFCKNHGIRTSKRDELLNEILASSRMKLIAVAGTHGKTTTTAMVIWLLRQLKIPASYSVGAKISFGDMGHFEPGSEYFVYECDEFDRNFLAFHPYSSAVTGIAWDHHEVYTTWQDYKDAFAQFVSQSESVTMWREDWRQLGLGSEDKFAVLEEREPRMKEITLLGRPNRQNAWLAVNTLHRLNGTELEELIPVINTFPGLNRRFERITGNLYSDYAHTPEKISGALHTAKEAAEERAVVVVYEPLTNRRMYHTIDLHKGLFKEASRLYWVPTYLAREDPGLAVLSPKELIGRLSPEEQAAAEPMELDSRLKAALTRHLEEGDLVLCLSGGGGNSLDEWLRREFAS